jgi:hypothetical protein
MSTETCDLLIAGCGPASLATLVYMEQIGCLQQILKHTSEGSQYSVVLVDPAKKQNFGVGALGQYISASNTSGCMFALNVFRPRDVNSPLKPEPTHDPVEIIDQSTPTLSSGLQNPTQQPISTTGSAPPTLPPPSVVPPKPKLLPSTLFEPLRNTAEAQSLLKVGAGFTRLCNVAPFFRVVMQTILNKRFEVSNSKGLVMAETYVEQIVVRNDGKYDVHVRTESEEDEEIGTLRVFTAKKVLLAMGGKPKDAFQWMKKYVEEGDKKSKKRQNRLLISADEFLKSNGFVKVFKHLRSHCGGQSVKKRMSGSKVKVIVIGGAHSALSVIHTLLNGADGEIDSDGMPVRKKILKKNTNKGVKEAKKESINAAAAANNNDNNEKIENNKVKKQKKLPKNKKKLPIKNLAKKNDTIDRNNEKNPEEKNAPPNLPKPGLAMYSFLKDEILMLHRSEVRMFWGNKNEAKKAGIIIDEKRVSQDEKGSINVYTGLRGRSKALWRTIKKKTEKRVKAIMYTENKMIENKVYHSEPDVIIYATGYGCRVPLILDENGAPLNMCTDGKGALNTTNKCQIYLIDRNKRKKLCSNIVATGLGSSLKTSHPDIGGEKLLKNVRADGVNIYMNQQARMICHGLYGKENLLMWMNNVQHYRREEKSKKPIDMNSISKEINIGVDTNKLKENPTTEVVPKLTVKAVDNMMLEIKNREEWKHPSYDSSDTVSPSEISANSDCSSDIDQGFISSSHRNLFQAMRSPPSVKADVFRFTKK